MPGTVATASHTSGPPVPSVLRCLVLLAGVKLALAAAGFTRTLRWIRERSGSIAPLDEVRRDAIAATEHAVAMAAALYPGRAECLERSLALYYYLRRAGVAVEFRLGVQQIPFAAHAWVECGGDPINDVPEHVRWFTPFPDRLP